MSTVSVCVCTVWAFPLFVLQLAKWLEDSANKNDVAPVDLETKKLTLSRDDENKYPLLSGTPVVNLRLRAAILQVRA